MRNIKLIVVYEGTAYAGFQRQTNAPTIQAALEEALLKLTGERTPINGAGRTDAGVHALGQVVNFKTNSALALGRFSPALNSMLPRDIAVMAAAEVPLDFHARFSARSKTYAYRIWTAQTRPVFERDRTYHYTRPLDLPAMTTAAGLLIGRHDFACFQAAGSSARTTVRTVHSAAWRREDEMLVFTIKADGFLYHMVRNIVGTMLLIGLGRHGPDWLTELMAGGDRKAAGPTAPAAGLFLVKVDY